MTLKLVRADAPATPTCSQWARAEENRQREPAAADVVAYFQVVCGVRVLAADIGKRTALKERRSDER